MLKRILNRLKEKCGAATIEAVVAFTGFLFVIVTILNVANYCRAQMVISNAVDAAARELAQYSYFYNMTGMDKFNNYVNENAGIGAANINDVIDGTNSVYTTLSSALSDTTDYGNQLADKVDNQNLTYQDIQTAVLKIDTNSTNIMSSITAMEAKFSSVERNPLLYMKSLAAVASGEALDLAKSYVIAAPLAKLFTSANINSGEISVQQYLENLGIVGGFDGLNFNTSTMFSPGEQDDIHLRCYYKISLCNFVDKSLFDIPICKEAHCRAWLGGDDNPVKVSQQAAVQPAAGTERSMADVGDVSGNESENGEEVNSDAQGENSDQSYVESIVAIEGEDYEDYANTEDNKEEKENTQHRYYATYEEYLADFNYTEEEARALFDENGVFLDPEDEKDYQEYLKRKEREGKPARDRLDWKKASSYWTEYSYVARGNNYNHSVWDRGLYDYNEIVVDGGYRLDSYIPGEAIISRKATDLNQIDESTFRKYLSEFEEKYAVGTIIDSKKYKKDFYDAENDKWSVLEGEYVLEIPASNANLENIDYYIQIAAEYNVTLKFTEE